MSRLRRVGLDSAQNLNSEKRLRANSAHEGDLWQTAFDAAHFSPSVFNTMSTITFVSHRPPTYLDLLPIGILSSSVEPFLPKSYFDLLIMDLKKLVAQYLVGDLTQRKNQLQEKIYNLQALKQSPWVVKVNEIDDQIESLLALESKSRCAAKKKVTFLKDTTKLVNACPRHSGILNYFSVAYLKELLPTSSRGTLVTSAKYVLLDEFDIVRRFRGAYLLPISASYGFMMPDPTLSFAHGLYSSGIPVVEFEQVLYILWDTAHQGLDEYCEFERDH